MPIQRLTAIYYTYDVRPFRSLSIYRVDFYISCFICVGVCVCVYAVAVVLVLIVPHEIIEIGTSNKHMCRPTHSIFID